MCEKYLEVEFYVIKNNNFIRHRIILRAFVVNPKVIDSTFFI